MILSQKTKKELLIQSSAVDRNITGGTWVVLNFSVDS
jgi:hypothetical protein